MKKTSEEAPPGKAWRILWADGRGVQYFRRKRDAQGFYDSGKGHYMFEPVDTSPKLVPLKKGVSIHETGFKAYSCSTKECRHPSHTKKASETLTSIAKLDHLKNLFRQIKGQVQSIVPTLERITPEKRLHVTLTYADKIKTPDVDDVAARMHTSLQEGGSIPLKVKGVTSFENPQGEGIVALKVTSPELTEAHQKLKQINLEAGGKFTFPRYKPHVTLGYSKVPLTPQQKAQLRQIQPTITNTQIREVDITTKGKDGWDLVAKTKLAADLLYTLVSARSRQTRKRGGTIGTGSPRNPER